MPSSAGDLRHHALVKARQWRQLVEPHFGFLIDSGFNEIDLDDSSWWATSMLFRSGIAAVRVELNSEFGRVEVQLIRLVDGAVPDYPIWITSERVDWVLLDDVIEARRPELISAVRAQKGLKPGAADAQLQFWARALLEIAPEFLTGDLSAIDDGAAIVRQRVADHPQELTVWSPHDATAADEEAAARRVAEDLPPEVNLVRRRYFRFGRRAR